MKKFILFIFFQILILSNLYAQIGWFWQNPIPQGNTLNDNFFVNENTGFCIGNKGVILKTTSSGINWQIQYLSTTQNLNSIKFINPNTGFIVGDSSKIFRTIDAGFNWNKINYSGNYKFTSIDFLNANTGILVASNIILKSIDSGQNWTTILSLSSNYILKQVMYLNTEIVYIVGQKYIGGLPGYYTSVILKSTDGGSNWTETNLNTSVLNGIIKISDSNIVCVGHNSIFKTTDQGITWTNRISGIFANFKDITFFDNNIGIVVGFDGNARVLRTVNGGDSWIEIMTYGFEPNSIKSSSINEGFIVGKNGSILKTSNAGSSWTLLPTVLQVYGNFYNVEFFNENTGYIMGIGYDYPQISGGSILKTTNGGENWLSQIHCGGHFTDMFFTSINTGYITGGNEFYIMRTTNGGINWNCRLLSWSGSFKSIWFSDSLNGTAVGDYGKIYRTNNSGINWTSQYDNVNIYLRSVHFINSTTGTAVGSGQGGAILRTTNGGNQWEVQSLGVGSFYNLYGVFFINEDIGFIIGQNSSIYKTLNGGNNWVNISSFNNVKFNKIKFFDDSTGIIVGDNGLFLRTTNQGSSWGSINTGTDQHLYGFSFVNENIGTIVGSNLSILKTTTGGVVNVNLNSIYIRENFNLSQNYPNPFNPSTTIKFSIPKSIFVELNVYDILGRKVMNLVNEILQNGTYQVEFNAFNLPSGIYFYSFDTEEFKETKIMLLIK